MVEAPAESLGRIPARKTLQDRTKKRTASAEEEKGQRDSAARASLRASLGFLPLPLTFSFLLRPPSSSVFVLSCSLWSVVKSNKSKSGGNGSFNGRYSKEARVRVEDSGP